MTKTKNIFFPLVFNVWLCWLSFLLMEDTMVVFGLLEANRPRAFSSQFQKRFQLRSTTSTSSSPLILSPLPNLYVYEHCPFCIRVRLALGQKKIKHRLHYLANDDKDTPTALIGKKMVPIFEYSPKKILMGESLDIIKLIDNDLTFGPVGSIKLASGRSDLATWMNSLAEISRWLLRPRYMMTIFPEFATEEARDAYRKNHPLPCCSVEQWSLWTEEERRSLYEKAFHKEGQEFIQPAENDLQQLSSLIYSTDFCTEGGFSYDDIDLWARLRGLTLVKNLSFPPKVLSYLQNLSQQSDIPLFSAIAL